MKIKNIICGLLLLFVLSFNSLKAQESSVAAGGDINGTGGSVSYSIGQVLYSFNADNKFSEAQGVQQAFEISDITAIKNVDFDNLNCKVYPNPSNDALNLKVENSESIDLDFQIYDLTGKLVMKNLITDTVTTISTINLPAAAYILKISKNGEVFQSFKVIKN